MNTKLTLNIEETVIRKAKAFAHTRRKSLSRLVEQYLQFVTGETEIEELSSDRVNAIADTLSIDPNVKYDDLKQQYLTEKHLRATDTD